MAADDSTNATTGDASPRRRRGRLLLAGVMLALFLFGAGTYLYLRDGPPPDDSDLMERDPVVPEDQNGLVQLRKMGNNLLDFDSFAASRSVDDETAQKIYSGEAGNDTLVRDFLTQAQPDITELKRIVELPYFAFNDKISITTVIPEVAKEYGLARVLAIAAREAQHDGDYAQAVQDVLLLRHLVLRLMEIRGSLVHSLTTMGCNGIAAKAMEDLLNDPALPPHERDLLAQAFVDDAPWKTLMSRSVVMEYQFSVSMIEDIKQNKPGAFPSPSNRWADAWVRLTLRESTTRAELAGFYRTMRQQWNGPYAAINFTALVNSSFPNQPKSGIAYYTAPNFGGRLLVDGLVPSWQSLLEFPYKETAVDRMLRTGLALRRYYDDQHVLPIKLDDLVPQYLPAVPLDPFDDKPLRYDASRGLVYSVGTSLKDSGGSKYIGKTPATDPNYHDPLDDPEQPTLELKFQKPPVPTIPAPAPLPLGMGTK
jgi:hypothetical protein